MEYWLTVCLNNKDRFRMKIAESGNFAFKEKYLVKKFEIDNIGNSTQIPIDIYIKDKESGDDAVILHKKTFLEKNKSVFQFLDNLIDIFVASKTVPVEVVINKTPDGINVGFMSARFKATHVHIPMNDKAEVSENHENASTEAKELFLSNINFFDKPIRATWNKDTTLSDVVISEMWITCINTIKDSAKLLSLFKSCNNDISIWKNIVESWGLKMDKGKKYPYQLIDKAFYDIISEEKSSAQYVVIEPCITLWTTKDGKKNEICVLRGKVKLWES